MRIQILGAGCSKCSRAAQVMRENALQLGLIEGRDFELEKVTDIQEIMKYKVVFTPGIIIDGRVISTGKVPSASEAQGFINSAMGNK